MQDAASTTGSGASKGKGKGRARKGEMLPPPVPDVAAPAAADTFAIPVVDSSGPLKRSASPSQEDRPAKVSGVFPLGLFVFSAEC